jgi:diguanylate cyclase (GGDEF)-like protein
MPIVRIRLNRVIFKLFSAFLFLILVTAIPIFYFSISEQEKLIRSYVRKTNDAFANFIASNVIKVLNKTRMHVEMFASFEDFRNMDPRKVRKQLRRLMEKDPLFYAAGVYDLQKDLVASTDHFIESPHLENLFSNSLLHRYGMSLFEGKGKSQSGPRRPKQAEFRVLIRDNGGLSGVLIVQLNMRHFEKDLNRAKVFLEFTNQYADIYILDETQKIISRSQDSRLEGTDALLASLADESETYVMDLQDYYGSFETPPWQVIFIPKGAAYAQLKKFKVTFGYFVVFYILVAGILGLVVARKITGPLRSLVTSAEKISKGNLETRVRVEAGDEIGELAEKFEEMRKNLRDYEEHLKKKITELQTLYNVGTIVTSELEYSALLKTILDTVIDVMSAEKGSIMIYDPHTGMLKIAMAKGLRKEVIRKTVLASGESVAGHVFQSQQPMLVLDTLKDDEFLHLKKKNIAPGTMLSVPLVSKERSLGVINVSKSMPYGFDNFDLNLFQAIGNICAAAIDNARLYRLAITDEMTGLFVRRFFQVNMKKLIAKTEETFALIMLDIDFFKSFNDRFGHTCGDNVLIQVARIISNSVRDCDIPCRLGGEEFAVICPGLNAAEAEAVAHRLKTLINEEKIETPGGGEEEGIGVSLGISEYPVDGRSVEEIYQSADQALYYSKNHGRNQITLFQKIPGNDLQAQHQEDPIV